MLQKKIACVGYHCTGAGVIDDLFREFDNVSQGAYEVETRVLQDPDGISDLEYNLVENPHRLNSGFAIKRFKKYVNRTRWTYSKIFGSDWERLSYEYAESLAKINYKGYWHGDIWLLNPVLQYYHLLCRGINKLLPKQLQKPSYYNYFPWLHTYHAVLSEESFLNKTKMYVEALCLAMNKESKEYVLLDQILSPNNPMRYMRYIDNVKVIIVDRDPRDVYITQKLYKEHTLPMTPKEFCVVYRDVRETVSEIPPDCLYVYFEDMVLNYDIFVPKILDFVGIDSSHHVKPYSHFNPTKSINGIRQWERYPQYSEDIKIIEEELAGFLYHIK